MSDQPSKKKKNKKTIKKKAKNGRRKASLTKAAKPCSMRFKVGVMTDGKVVFYLNEVVNIIPPSPFMFGPTYSGTEVQELMEKYKDDPFVNVSALAE